MRGTPCKFSAANCKQHGESERRRLSAQSPATLAGKASQPRPAEGGSGFRRSNGRYTGPGADYTADIREDKAFGSPNEVGVLDRMMRTSPSCMLAYRLYEGPIRSLVHTMRYEHNDGEKEILDRTKRWLFEEMEGFDLFTAERCLAMIYGHWTHAPEQGIANDGAAIITRMLSRPPWSLRRMETRAERLHRVEQVYYDDTGKQVTDWLDASRLMHTVHDRQGDHFTGISMLRPAYGPWKNIMETWRWLMIRIQRWAVAGPAVGMDDESFMNAILKDDLGEELENWSSNPWSHLLYPRGADGLNKLELFGGDSGGEDLVLVLRYFEWSILSAVAGQFLALGGTDSGSRAVGAVHAQVFWRSLKAKILELNSALNDVSGRTLGSLRWFVDLNFGPQKVYPTLVAPVLRTETFESFAAALSTLKQAGFVTPLMTDEAQLRDEFELQAYDETQIRANTPELFAYDQENGIVRIGEIRERKGLPPDAELDGLTVPEYLQQLGLGDTPEEAMAAAGLAPVLRMSDRRKRLADSDALERLTMGVREAIEIMKDGARKSAMNEAA